MRIASPPLPQSTRLQLRDLLHDIKPHGRLELFDLVVLRADTPNQQDGAVYLSQEPFADSISSSLSQHLVQGVIDWMLYLADSGNSDMQTPLPRAPVSKDNTEKNRQFSDSIMDGWNSFVSTSGTWMKTSLNTLSLQPNPESEGSEAQVDSQALPRRGAFTTGFRYHSPQPGHPPKSEIIPRFTQLSNGKSARVVTYKVILLVLHRITKVLEWYIYILSSSSSGRGCRLGVSRPCLILPCVLS